MGGGVVNFLTELPNFTARVHWGRAGRAGGGLGGTRGRWDPQYSSIMESSRFWVSISQG